MKTKSDLRKPGRHFARWLWLPLLAGTLVALGPPYTLDWSTIDGGGMNTGGVYFS